MKMRKENPEKTKLKKTDVPIATVEPATTLHDDGKFFRVITALPGVAEEKIRIDLENHATSVTIIAADTGIQYKKVITIPFEVRFSKKRFSDGILELTLEKAHPAPI